MWWNKAKSSCAVAVLASYVLAGAGGCSSSGKQAPAAVKAVDKIKTVREGLANSDKQVDDVLLALNQLSTSGDLAGAYKKYVSEVGETERMAGKVANRAAELRERRKEYVQEWEERTGEVSDEAMRASMAERQKRVGERFDAIRKSLQGASDSYKPFMANLKDIQTALSLDLTSGGVTAAGPAIARANQKGQELKKNIQSAIAKLDEVSEAMTPTKMK